MHLIPDEVVIDCTVAAAWLMPADARSTANQLLDAAPKTCFVLAVLILKWQEKLCLKKLGDN